MFELNKPFFGRKLELDQLYSSVSLGTTNKVNKLGRKIDKEYSMEKETPWAQ